MRKTLEYLGDQIRKHDTALNTIYTEHREKKAKNLEIYKPEEAEKQNARLIEYNRARVANADEQLSIAFGVAADRMRSALARHATAPVNHDLADNLRMLQDFGIKMSRMELNTYIKQAAGNLTALRCLAVIAKNSGFTLNFAGVDDLQKDIDLFDRMGRTPMMVVPLTVNGDDSLIREAKEVLPDVPFRAADGRVLYTMGRPTSTLIASSSAYLESVEKKMLPAIIDRWTHSIVPTLEEIRERLEKENDGEQAEEAQNEHNAAVEVAAEGVTVHENVRWWDHMTPEEAEKNRKIIEKYM